MTQEALAAAVGVTRSYINMTERGKVNPPSVEVVARIERVLNIPEGELGVLAELDRIPDRFKHLVGGELVLDDAALRGTGQLLDIIGREFNAAWTLPDEKHQLARLLRPFLRHTSWETRRMACAVLGRLVWSGAVDDLRYCLHDGDTRVRAEAARLVAELDDEDVLPLFERAVADPDASVRLAAVAAAHRRPLREMLPVLGRIAQKDRDREVREAAARVRKRLDSAPAVLPDREGHPADASAAPRTISELKRAIRAVEKSNASTADLHVIPVLSYTAAGDPGNFTDGDYPPGFADDYVLAPTDISDPHAFGLRIRGDSMSPGFQPGDVVIVSPDTPLVEGLKIVTKIRDGEITCKIFASGDENRIVLSSENPAYGPMIVDRRDIVWIYPVVRSIRNELPL